MSEQSLRAQIKDRLDALGPVMGRVHDYERWSANTGQFLTLFQDPSTKKIMGWEIARTRLRTARSAMNRWKLTHRFVIRGYYGLEDAAATEKAFSALVDMVVLDFLRTRLPGTQGEQFPEAQVEPRMFGAVLCHVAEIVLPEVVEIVDALPEQTEDWTSLGLEYYLRPGDDVADAADLVDLDQP